MIILVGCSAAGKSTIEKLLVQKGYKNIVSYNSRPIRENEVNHRDYHFITIENFNKLKESNFFGESTCYNGWFYGISKDDIRGDGIAVVEPFGFRQLKKIAKENNFMMVSFFIDVPERIRLKRMIDRGDNLMEIFRRIFSDQGVFQGIGDEVTYTINNDRDIKLTINEIEKYLKN